MKFCIKATAITSTFTYLGLLLIICTQSVHSAEIYTYKDSRGKLYFTDNKMGSSFNLISVYRPNLIASSHKKYSIAMYKRNKDAYLPLIHAAAKQYEIDANLLHAVIDVESAFNPRAVSKVGAIGLMQLMPQTANGLGVEDSWNPAQNIDGGAKHLSSLLSQFNDNKKLALAAYNAGSTAIIDAGYEVPNYPETIHYVSKVLTKYQALNQ